MQGWNRLIDQDQLDSIQIVNNNIYEETREIEAHLHTDEIWFGNNAGNPEIDNLTPFTLISGNNAFGDAVQILDANDIPFRVGNISFDFHSFLATRLTSATVYLVRIIYGTGTVGEAEAANQYTTFPVIRITTGTVAKGSRETIKFPKIAAGNNVWARVKNATDDAELDLLFGLHEYPF